MDQVANRFGYYIRFDVNGYLSARQITNAGSIYHSYTDQNAILAFTPEDKYSDFTNRVEVHGQELDFTDVTFQEERITSISGTLGWWGCQAEHIIWFSDDKSRRCVNPRLQVIETALSMPFELAGDITEYLEECGPLGDNKYCAVYVTAPDLTIELAAAIAGAITGAGVPDDVVVPLGGGTGKTIPVGRTIQQFSVTLALMILGSVANYQFEVWAQPIGSVRRSLQAEWNDAGHQALIGTTVTKKIEDPLCYSVADCTQVANFEGMVAQMQRRRIKIKKLAHLQDEDGDTIRVLHPYSGQSIDIFITDINRTFKKGDGFFDEITGWVL
jgi:hypothetical protein